MPKRWIVWGLKSAIDRLTKFFGVGSQIISQILAAVKAFRLIFHSYFPSIIAYYTIESSRCQGETWRAAKK
mgnify:CR=1 FL=1